MKHGDILECRLLRHDEHGYVLVEHEGETGLVAPQHIGINPEAIPPVGSTIKVAYLFPIGDDEKLEFSFVASIEEVEIENHPISLADNSMVGERFRSRVFRVGAWGAVKHPIGLFGVLPRDQFPGSIEPDTEVEVEIIGIDHEHRRLLIRLVRSAETTSETRTLP